jgi:hypothetical protein
VEEGGPMTDVASELALYLVVMMFAIPGCIFVMHWIDKGSKRSFFDDAEDE